MKRKITLTLKKQFSFKCLLMVFFLALSFSGMAQTTIYQENFSGFSNGYIGTNAGSDIGVWAASVSGACNNKTYWGTYDTGGLIDGMGLKTVAIGASCNLGTGSYTTGVTTTNLFVYTTISTTGYTGITLEFDWKGVGEKGTAPNAYDYGRVIYRTGTTGAWQILTTGGNASYPGKYVDKNTTQHTVLNLPAGVNNLAKIQFGFRWDNDNSAGAAPGFSIDNIVVKGTPISSDRTLTVSGAYPGATRANGNHTIANNTSVTATSGTRTGYNVTGWTGTGSVPATGSTGSATFTITQNSTITWNWQQIGLPNNLAFYNTGGSEQLTFNNSLINNATPIFRLSHGTDPATDYQVEINTASTFTGGTSWTQTFTGTYPLNTQANFTFTNGFTPIAGTTYYVRARAKGAAGTYSVWTTETYSFTHDTSVVVPNWFQTTQAQFTTDALSGLQTNTNGDILPTSGGGNIITNGSFEGGSISGWTVTRPGNWYTVASEAYGNTVGTNALNIYNNNPGSFGYFSGDAAGAYQTVNLTGISNISFSAGYESTTGSGLIVQCRVYISETTQTEATAGTLIQTWTPSSVVSMGNVFNINISSYNFTGNKLLKFIYYVTGQEITTNERYLYIDNVQTSSVPSGTATSIPITLTSVQNATKYNTIKWNQTLNGGAVSLKVQQYNGSSWADVSGYTTITATGNGEKTFDVSAMTAYAQIRLVASLSGSATVTLHDWSVIFENPCTAAITSVTNGSGCSDITLLATGAAGTTEYRWYDAATGGTLSQTTTTGEWVISGLTQTTTYYVAAYNGTCESARVAVTATYTPTTAEITFTEGVAICEPGTVTVYADANGSNNVLWYDAATGGNLLFTGTVYTFTATDNVTFYVAAAEGTCESSRTEVTVTFNGKTWNGTLSNDWNSAGNWTPTGVPTADNCVVIGTSTVPPVILSGTNASAKSLTLLSGGALVVKSGSSIDVAENVTVAIDANMTLENEGYLVQTVSTSSNTNVGAITVKRNSTPMFRSEATGWASPVEDQKLYDFAIGTVFGRIYEYDETSNVFVNSSITLQSPFVLGKGYSVRSPDNYPTFSAVTPTTPLTFEGSFTGKPNNGDIGINLTLNNLGINYVGNPYPSPISATDLFDANSIADAFYFWTHEAPPINGVYAANNYATFNKGTGGVQAAAGGLTPNGTIEVGQGFVVRTSGAGTLQFTNAMRTNQSGGQFFRQADATADRHRMWLNLSNSENNFNQILIGYVPFATMEKDNQIDAKMIGYASSTLSSLIDNDTFVIQGRSLPFVDTDEVPLGFKAKQAGMFTIAIDHVDGLFLEGQTIYLMDALLGTTHDLSQSAYSFMSEQGTFNTRFKVVYQPEALSVNNPELNNNNWIVYKNENQINIKSNGFDIESVEIYDLTGRLLLNQQNVNSATFSCAANFAQQVLLVRVNKVLVKKVL